MWPFKKKEKSVTATSPSAAAHKDYYGWLKQLLAAPDDIRRARLATTDDFLRYIATATTALVRYPRESLYWQTIKDICNLLDEAQASTNTEVAKAYEITGRTMKEDN